MASVDLDRAWLHRTDDLSVYVSAFSADWNDVETVAGEVRTYAGGRMRIVSRPRRQQTLSVTLRYVPLADIDTLRDWAGDVLMLRDKRGRKLYGTFFTSTVKDLKGVAYADVEFTFSQVTYIEAV